MPDPSRLRDSTQIILPRSSLDGLRDTIETEFTVSLVDENENCRIIGSPAEIKSVSEFLARQGISVQ